MPPEVNGAPRGYNRLKTESRNRRNTGSARNRWSGLPSGFIMIHWILMRYWTQLKIYETLKLWIEQENEKMSC